MLLHEIVEQAALRSPDAPALVVGDRSYSFSELDDRVTGLAGALQQLSEPGDRVAFVGDNCEAWVDCYYAVPKAGRVLVFLNQRLRPRELEAIIASTGARLLLGQSRHLEPLVLPACVERVVSVEHDYDDLLGAGALWREPPAAEVAWIIHTSGTTGQPKGAMLTHTGLHAAVRATVMARDVTPDDVYLLPFPLCHVAGYNVLLFHLFDRPVVLMPRFEAAGLIAAVREHGVTTVSLAPTMISTLLDELDRDGGDLPSLRNVWYGASGIPGDLLRRAMARLPVGFHQGYGMTELSGNAAFLDADDHRRAAAGDERLLRAAGRPSPLVELRVLDDGEIVVRGDQVTVGYWGDAAATAEAFVDGWFHTGDLGRLDDDGYLTIVDRKKDVIVTGGENVASREVEDVISAHPGVQEVAVVGVPDAHWGEGVCAVVVLRPGYVLTTDEVVGMVAARLAGFKKPRQVVFADVLPKNDTGKVLKAVLRMHLAGGIRHVYDRVADRYAATFYDELDRKPFDRDRLDAFAAAVAGRGPVLDVGAGPAHIARYLRDRGAGAFGVDLSPAMGVTARRLQPGRPFVVADMRWLPFGRETIAGIAAFYSIIHLDRADVPLALSEFHRVLREDAPLLVAFHGGTGTTRTDEFLGERLTVEATLFGLDEMAGMVEAAGFTVAEAVARDPYPFEHATPRLYVSVRR